MIGVRLAVPVGCCRSGKYEVLRASNSRALGRLGLSTCTAPKPIVREIFELLGTFATQTSQLALTRTSNRDLINFVNAEIAEQAQVASALGASARVGASFRTIRPHVMCRDRSAGGEAQQRLSLIANRSENLMMIAALRDKHRLLAQSSRHDHRPPFASCFRSHVVDLLQLRSFILA